MNIGSGGGGGGYGSSYIRTTRFALISSGTSGTVTLPPNSQVVLNDFGGTVDAVVVQVDSSYPTQVPALTAAGVVVATSFDSSGNYTFTDTPSSYPVAILYRVQQQLQNFDSTASNIWGGNEFHLVLPVADGGTGRSSLTQYGVLIGEGGGNINSSATGSSGQLFQSLDGSQDPSWTTATYPGTAAINDVMYATSANQWGNLAGITVAVLAAGFSGTPYYIQGTTNTVLRNTGLTLTFGTLNLGTDVTGILGLTLGGTGATTLTAHGVLLGEGSGKISATAAGSSGQILQSQGAADPIYTTATYPGTATINSIPYASAANTYTNLAGITNAVLAAGFSATPYYVQGTTFTVLRNTGPSLIFGAVNLGTDVTGLLGIALGGIGTTTLTNHGVIIGADGSALNATATGTSGLALIAQGNSADPIWGFPRLPLMIVQEQQSSGTSAGGFTAGSWVQRVLNTVVTNNIAGSTLSSNQITLGAGTYLVEASAPGCVVDRHQAVFYNTTDSAFTLVGTSEHSGSADFTTTRSFIQGVFSIASQKVFEIDHRCQTTKTVNGLGAAVTLGQVEVYTTAKIYQLA